MTTITTANIAAINAIVEAGKTPWLTIANDKVQGVFDSRTKARDAKNGAATKYEAGAGYVLESTPLEMRATEPGDYLHTELAETAAVTALEATEEELEDAAGFAADKEELPAELPANTVKVIPAVEKDAPKAADKAADIIRKSTPLRPTKLVWQIADDMKAANPNVTRKEIMAECEARGIAFFTARTQYQVWKQMQANEAAK